MRACRRHPVHRDMHVAYARAAGLVCTRCTSPRCGCARRAADLAHRHPRVQRAPDGLRAMTDWLRGHGVTAAAMEGTGVYWRRRSRRRRRDRCRPERPARQTARQEDRYDSLWLSRICQFGLCPARPAASVPAVGQLTRYRRKLKPGAQPGPQDSRTTAFGGVLSDIFERAPHDGLVAGHSPRHILAELTHHVAAKLEPLAKALAATLNPLALFTPDADGGRRPRRRRADEDAFGPPCRSPTPAAVAANDSRHRFRQRLAIFEIGRRGSRAISGLGRRGSRQQHQRR